MLFKEFGTIQADQILVKILSNMPLYAEYADVLWKHFNGNSIKA